MSISMYQIAIPDIIHMLNNLSALLEKGKAYADEKEIDFGVLSQSRLYPDMLPLARQVHIATDLAKGCGARLAGMEPPKYEDVEVSFHDLQQRIQKTSNFLENLKPDQVDGTEDKEITLKVGGEAFNMSGISYLLSFVKPNLYFHITTTYNILRHNGVEIGKRDFLGRSKK